MENVVAVSTLMDVEAEVSIENIEFVEFLATVKGFEDVWNAAFVVFKSF